MSEWDALRRRTAARIGLARSGASLATGALLEFRLAHARARDAVHAEWNEAALADALGGALLVASQAADRRAYLLRPDLGRALREVDSAALADQRGEHDLAIIVADGLSAQAAERHAPSLLARLLPALRGWRLAPLTLARHARVALGDRVAAALGARAALILIGERPGLSAPDSLGAYLTWAPSPATTDAERNCVSNIRPEGLGYDPAARTIAFLLGRMRELRLSGVALKDDSGSTLLRS